MSQTILVVEDDAAIGALVTKILSHAGYQVIVASDGAAGVKAALATPSPDLVLMDISLPEKNGLVATREIRVQNHEVPIIAVSARAMINDQEAALDAGCNAFLPKPFSLTAILAIISQYLPPPT